MSEHNVSQLQMAAKLDIEQARVSEWSRGKVEPGITKVEAIAHELGYRLELVPIDVDGGL